MDGEGASAKPLKVNAGFQYELDLIRALREKGFNVSDPAGADSAKADLELTPTYKAQVIKLVEYFKQVLTRFINDCAKHHRSYLAFHKHYCQFVKRHLLQQAIKTTLLSDEMQLDWSLSCSWCCWT